MSVLCDADMVLCCGGTGQLVLQTCKTARHG